MISYQSLGQAGRFGNQLFQYAFLRTTARRLGVSFYCPTWLGDQLFDLNDGLERSSQSKGIEYSYRYPHRHTGFNPCALEIKDGADIYGQFQTEKYFDLKSVKSWYVFKEEMIARVREKYKGLDFSQSVGIHLRFGDMRSTPSLRARFYAPSKAYYQKALSLVKHKQNILVFSDEIGIAKTYFKDKVILIEGNTMHEDFYLMSLCHDFVCSVSTFSWWAAWLNAYPDKTIVCPKEGPFRPGSLWINRDYWPNGWEAIPALIPVWDNFWIFLLRDPQALLEFINHRFHPQGRLEE